MRWQPAHDNHLLLFVPKKIQAESKAAIARIASLQVSIKWPSCPTVLHGIQVSSIFDCVACCALLQLKLLEGFCISLSPALRGFDPHRHIVIPEEK